MFVLEFSGNETSPIPTMDGGMLPGGLMKKLCSDAKGPPWKLASTACTDQKRVSTLIWSAGNSSTIQVLNPALPGADIIREPLVVDMDGTTSFDPGAVPMRTL